MELLTSNELEKAAAVLKLIAHPVRLSVVNRLSAVKSMTVNELVALLEIDQPLVSHHLSQMRLRGILAARKQGKEVHYSLKEPNLVRVLECIKLCHCHI
jgi:ArsR family transcriptional regulator